MRDNTTGFARRDLPMLLFLAPSALAMAWLIANAQWFWEHRADLGFGYGVPVLCAYLFWRGWESKPPPRLQWTWGVIFLASLGTLLLFLVQIYQAAFGTMAASLMGLAVGVLLMVAANLGFVFGQAGIRHFALAFAFILVALPMPSAIQSPVVFGLQSLVTGLDVEALKLIGIPAQKVGSVIQLPNGTVGINEACSGIRSLQAATMMSLFIAHLKLRNLGLRAALVGLGVFWAVLGNFLRSLFLSCVANAKGAGAVETYHDSAGWYILAFTFAGVAVSAWVLRRLEKKALSLQSTVHSPRSEVSSQRSVVRGQ